MILLQCLYGAYIIYLCLGKHLIKSETGFHFKSWMCSEGSGQNVNYFPREQAGNVCEWPHRTLQLAYQGQIRSIYRLTPADEALKAATSELLNVPLGPSYSVVSSSQAAKDVPVESGVPTSFNVQRLHSSNLHFNCDHVDALWPLWLVSHISAPQKQV